MRVRLTPEAEADLEHALAWYAERSADLGADFLTCFEAVVQQVE
jgi:plasmid stabilization system protein ParE